MRVFSGGLPPCWPSILMAGWSRPEDVDTSCLGSIPRRREERWEARAAFLAIRWGSGGETVKGREGAGSTLNQGRKRKQTQARSESVRLCRR